MPSRTCLNFIMLCHKHLSVHASTGVLVNRDGHSRCLKSRRESTGFSWLTLTPVMDVTDSNTTGGQWFFFSNLSLFSVCCYLPFFCCFHITLKCLMGEAEAALQTNNNSRHDGGRVGGSRRRYSEGWGEEEGSLKWLWTWLHMTLKFLTQAAIVHTMTHKSSHRITDSWSVIHIPAYEIRNSTERDQVWQMSGFLSSTLITWNQWEESRRTKVVYWTQRFSFSNFCFCGSSH